MAGNQLVQWVNESTAFSVEKFLNKHPEYKETGEYDINIWPTLIYLAKETGLKNDQINQIFGKKLACSITDIVFLIMVMRLYRKEDAVTIMNTWRGKHISDVHAFMKNAEAGVPAEAAVSTEKALQDVIQAIQSGMSEYEKNIETFQKLTEMLQKQKEAENEPQPAETEADGTETSVKDVPENTTDVDEEKMELMVRVRVLEVQKEYDEKIKQLEKQLLEKDGEVGLLKKDHEIALLKQQHENDLKDAELTRLTGELGRYKGAVKEKDEELKRLRSEIAWQQAAPERKDVLAVTVPKPKKSFWRKDVVDESVPEDKHREDLLKKVLLSSEYPQHIKEAMNTLYYAGCDYKAMQEIDNPDLLKANVEMLVKLATRK